MLQLPPEKTLNRDTLKVAKGLKPTATVVLRAENPIPIDKLIASVTASSIERRKDGKVALFLCQVSANCPSEELKLNKRPTRMDFDPVKSTVRIWFVSYNARKPDLVIENLVAPAK